MVVLAGINAVSLVFDLLDVNRVLAAFVFVVIVVLAVSVFTQTRAINRREALARRPDYAAIARMERDIYGAGANGTEEQS